MTDHRTLTLTFTAEELADLQNAVRSKIDQCYTELAAPALSTARRDELARSLGSCELLLSRLTPALPPRDGETA